MSGKDLLKLLLLVFGFNKNVVIKTYKGEGGYTGYDISAESDEIGYAQVDCEGLLFHMYEILVFMNENNIKPTTINGEYSIKEILKMTSVELEGLPIVHRGDITGSNNNIETID